jgi:fucose 4-O-acetylase-like acetyltransferase
VTGWAIITFNFKEMEKIRIEWVDIVRGMAFMMVLYSHLKYCNENLMYYFSPVFLTTFFFISGYLFKSNFSFKQLLEQRLRTLLLPFFIFGFVNIILSQLITFNEHTSFISDLVDFLLQIRGRNDALWFIAALFIMNFPFYFMIKYSKNIRSLIICASILFILSTVYMYYLKLPVLPWHIQFIGFGCFYMALGYSYKQYEKKVTVFLEKKEIFWLSLLFYISILFVFQSFFQRSNISFGGSFYIVDALVLTILGISIMLKFAKMGGVKLFSFIGANSLCYFALHGKIYSLLQTIIEKVFMRFSFTHSTLIDFFLGIGVTVLDVLILIIPIMIINKYMPFILGKGFKFSFLDK